MEAVMASLLQVLVERLGRSNPTTYSAERVLDAIPDGWAKVDGEWVQLSYMEVNGMSVQGVVV
jgi:hypothetical protein